MQRIFTLILILLLVGTSPSVFAQNRSAYEYGSEFIWGFNKNTAGGLIGGVIFRKSDRMDTKLPMYQSFGIELMNIKHPKEVRRNSQRTGNFFIYGKSNYLFAIRPQYGRELILFNKAAQQGVEIKLNAAAGPTIGLLTPYYVEVAFDQNPSNLSSYNVPFNPSIPFSNIMGPGKLFEGLREATPKIGFNAKASLSFELGTIKSQVTGFEIGLLLDAYAGELILMPATSNRSVIPTAFLTLFYGTRK